MNIIISFLTPKNERVVQERFRLNPHKYERVILAICGLVRFRIGTLILPLEISAIPLG